MGAVNGFKVQGVAGDIDRVSVQSTEQSSHLLVRRRWKFTPARWTEIELARDELMVLKCNDGEAVVRIKSLGGPFGRLRIDARPWRISALAEGSVETIRLERNRAVFLTTSAQRHPARGTAGLTV